jgi:hypothetical protein
MWKLPQQLRSEKCRAHESLQDGLLPDGNSAASVINININRHQAFPRSFSRGYSRGWTLANRCKRDIGRNFSAGGIDVVNVSDTLPDDVVCTAIEAGFLVLVVGRNISVGALAQNLHLLPLHV